MNNFEKKYDCVVVGGGIFGLYSAYLLSSKGANVAILDKEKTVFNRASKNNQARIHRGYHYPRSLETAKKVSAYYDRFCDEFNFSLISPFKTYYAISKDNSITSLDEYINFCDELNLPLKEIDSSLFFKKNKVLATFEVEEACFDFKKIREFFLNEFEQSKKIDIFYSSFISTQTILGSNYKLTLNNGEKLITPIVINATYSNVNEINKLFNFSLYDVKYELCELILCLISSNLSRSGLTVVDGPFFSLMPFNGGDLHSLSSVRLTPIDTSQKRPQDIKRHATLKKYETRSSSLNWLNIKSLVENYLDDNIKIKYKHSFLEIKPILISSEIDDARPTIVTVHSKNPFFISILSGKISTIYDLDDVLRGII